MRSALYRAVEVAAVCGILGFAGIQLWQRVGDPGQEFMAVVGACVGLLGVVAGDFAGRRSASPVTEQPLPKPPEGVLKEAMDRVLTGIRGYLEDNLIYRDDLKGIDASLASTADPVRAREAISELRTANKRMEERSAQLTDELEASRREIVALRENVNEVERLALLDALTDVGNRRFFDNALKQDMATCASSGADLCLALADIDRFKLINDKFGHVVGDHLLKSFAEVLTSASNGRVKTARYGGEEFALLFPGVPFPEARRIVETLRKTLEGKRWVVGPREQPLGVVTASFGLAKLAPGETAESFVHRADSRLMRAKAMGRNRVIAEDSVTPMRAAS